MPIPITCSTCGVKFNAPDTAIGKRGKCPKCLSPFVVPDPQAAAGFEVIEDAPIVPEIVEDSPKVVVAKPLPKPAGKSKKPNARNKHQIDPSDYRTKVNGKPLAVKDGEQPPPAIPRTNRG